MGFLFTKRWLVFLVIVLALAFLAVQLGDWQFRRLAERRQQNAQIRVSLRAAPVPATDLLRTTREPAAATEWRRVTVSGSWDDQNTVVIRYRTRDSRAGVDVVTPLVTSSGTAVVVDRGWMAAANNGSRRPRTPPASPGQVTIVGYVRVDGTGGSTTVAELSARAISAASIGRATGRRVYRGFVMLTDEAPTPATRLAGPELPTLDDGPHFFYGLQWWFFGVLAVGGFGYLAYDERRRVAEGRRAQLVR